jgi:hypothetical protein
MDAYSIAGINSLAPDIKRDIFVHMIPEEIFDRFDLPPNLIDEQENSLLKITGNFGHPGIEVYLYHEIGFQDPLIYTHLTDTLNGQVHILLYVMNDPESQRFDIDRMPDGTKTMFGTILRNREAELAAMEAGLLPGQIRSGLKILPKAITAFESFVENLGHNRYFTEPLFYHNAIIFERYGYSYQSGRRKMEEIHQRFTYDEEVLSQLGTNPFRQPAAKTSIFYRSWAIHDGILGERFTNVTMYKMTGKRSSVQTAPGIHW